MGVFARPSAPQPAACSVGVGDQSPPWPGQKDQARQEGREQRRRQPRGPWHLRERRGSHRASTYAGGRLGAGASGKTLRPTYRKHGVGAVGTEGPRGRRRGGSGGGGHHLRQ